MAADPSAILARAAMTLASGANPVGRPLNCALTAQVLAARCSAGSQPSAAVVPPSGFLPSTSSALAPPAATAATLAWDPKDLQAVLFGGLGAAGPLSTTWTFNGTWKNVTNPGDAPPPRYGAAMAFDNQSGSMVLFGGCGVTQCPLGDTWTFQSDGWTNETASLGTSTPTPSYDASMTTFGNHGAVLFGGCTDRLCTSQVGTTDLFENNSNCPANYQPNPCWIPQSGVGPSSRAGAALGYFPPDNVIVLYGGYAGSGAGLWHDLNDTWVLHDGAWQNSTFTQVEFPGEPYPAQGRSFASFFYYGGAAPLDGEMYLYGGYNHTTGAAYGQLWAAVVLQNTTAGWANYSVLGQPPPRAEPALASTWLSGPSENYAAILVGGTGPDSALLNDTWVFENQTVLSPAVTPVFAETNQTLSFAASAVGGTSPVAAQWAFGDGSIGQGLVTSHAYATAGNYTATVMTTDAWGVQNSSSVEVGVHFPSINLTLPSAIDTNVSAEFSASLINGTPLSGTSSKYTVVWNIPGHAVTPGMHVAVVFTTSGVKECSVEVTDGSGTQVGLAFAVTVNPMLVANPTFTPSNPKPGATVYFAVSASGGTPPYTFAWEFGSGRGANTSAPTNYYTKAGSYTVEVWANDSIGTSTETNLTVNVGTTAPPFVFDWSRGVWVFVAIGIVVAVVVFLAILGRRRRPAAVATPPTSSLTPWTPPTGTTPQGRTGPGSPPPPS
jgi:hypothetical protein